MTEFDRDPDPTISDVPETPDDAETEEDQDFDPGLHRPSDGPEPVPEDAP